MTDLSQSREKDKINPVVFYTSAGLILLFSLMTIFFRDFSAEWIGRTLDWVSKTFGWYYLLAATLYIVFVVCIACSRFGSVKLGPEQSKPEFSLLSWAAMLFAAGIGIAVILLNYYSVSLSEYVSSTATGSVIALGVIVLALGAVIRYLTKNDNLAYAFSFILLLAIAAVCFIDSSKFEGLLPRIMEKLSLFERFYTFVNGVFDMTAIVYFLSVIVFFLFLSVQSLEKRRYN